MVKEGLINLDFADVRSVMREMGKAMMGTGEASGEGRAMAAAEAAIANPLLDETSMKGAKGLLISITGGRDLTLFEVDEAATRIREEVDQDANIILGATFDESLEGVIRVSVVATGIDKAAMEVYGHAAEARAAAAFAARSVPQAAPAPVHAPMPAPVAAAPAPVAQAPVAPQPAYQPAPVAMADIEDDFTAALEAEIAQVAPRAPAPRQPVQQPAQARMPRVEDFPPVVQAEIERRGAGVEASADERGPMGLLRRLTTGLSRREEDEAVLADPVRPAATRRPAEASPYAPRRQAADSAARPVSQVRQPSEEDQLEIPAFLRRQSN